MSDLPWGDISMSVDGLYFIHRFDSCDHHEQEDELRDTQEMLADQGLTLVDYELEHDCLSGTLVLISGEGSDRVRYANYTIKGEYFLEDGHTMFRQDVLKNLRRKSALERELDIISAEIKRLSDALSLISQWTDSDQDTWGDIGLYAKLVIGGK